MKTLSCPSKLGATVSRAGPTSRQAKHHSPKNQAAPVLCLVHQRLQSAVGGFDDDRFLVFPVGTEPGKRPCRQYLLQPPGWQRRHCTDRYPYAFHALGNHRVGSRIDWQMASTLRRLPTSARSGQFSQSGKPGPLLSQRMAMPAPIGKRHRALWICAAVGFWMSSKFVTRPADSLAAASPSHVYLHAGSPRRLPPWLRRQVRLLECSPRALSGEERPTSKRSHGDRWPKGRLMGSWRTVRRALARLTFDDEQANLWRSMSDQCAILRRMR